MAHITIKETKVPILRQETSSRGGGVEVDLTPLGYKGHKMTAYQNYLGGGLLSSIGNSCTISNWLNVDDLCKIAIELSQYLHSLTNPEGEFEEATFKELQKRPLSAY
jgi:hypothetical protein